MMGFSAGAADEAEDAQGSVDTTDGCGDGGDRTVSRESRTLIPRSS